MSPSDLASEPRVPWWLHYWAVLTVCATLPLLLLGAEVTTKQVGMVDPQGFRTPWHLFTVPWMERGLGYVIEHSHRLAGFVVGTCVIVLAAGLWWGQQRRWLRWVGLAALGGVIVQGLLGGFRVNLNALLGRNLALVHGCFAQLVFAVLVSVVLFTSRSWSPSPQRLSPEYRGEGMAVRRWSLLSAGLVYLQIVFGALLRHGDIPLAPRLHLVLAFAVVALVAWQLKRVLDLQPRPRPLTGFVTTLVVVVSVQLLLGVEAWIGKFASPEWRQLQPMTAHPEIIRSLHYLVGSLVFATSVVVALQAHRGLVGTTSTEVAPSGRLEGAA